MFLLLNDESHMRKSYPVRSIIQRRPFQDDPLWEKRWFGDAKATRSGEPKAAPTATQAANNWVAQKDMSESHAR